MRRSNPRLATVSCISVLPLMDSPKLQTLRPNQSQLPPRLHLLSRLSSTNLKQANQTRGNPLLFIAVSATFALFFYLIALAKGFNFNLGFHQAKRFGIVIDGGSTGTRIHVFEFSSKGGVPFFNFEGQGLSSMKINPGLSAFEKDPEGAGDSLMDLLEFAKTRVPNDQWGDTEIRLMATAGLRILSPNSQQLILESCRNVLRMSGFRFQDEWASVITGSDEGLYAWVAANYALDTLGGDPLETSGIIELGGASAQVTFVPREPPPHEFSRTIRYRGVTYNLYSHSLLHFGQNVAYDSLQTLLISRGLKSASSSVRQRKLIDPCTPTGYHHDLDMLKMSIVVPYANNGSLPSVHAVGNFTECRSAALMLLQKGKEECLYHHCNIGSAFIPELRGKFLATENFFYTSKFFGLDPKASLSDLVKAGKHFCEEESWSNLKKRNRGLNEDELLKYCFSSAYIVALLHDSLGISMYDKRIDFVNQIQNISLDWALGAFILHASSNTELAHPNHQTSGDENLTFLALILVSALIVVAAWYISRWRKPQLKTIYDLENGRYIVTRVSR
ncbi:probable apyrase 6 isoform X1 [Amborella trichopoda]|nr:probable apyrase 6 isoform X1 [Amborella trichopoda]|eukprot:XP_006827247.2 probable apyrase 6 isoform X1 [Amborella trichopoda]